MQAAEERDVRVSERVLRRVAAIAPVGLTLPRVSRERQTEAAEFAEHGCTRRLDLRNARPRITMNVADVARAAVRPSARVVDEPARIAASHCVHDARRVVLAP